MEHLSAAELAGYRQRSLGPEELLRADAHIAACDECRRQLGSDMARRVASFRAGLGDDAAESTEHPTYEEIEAYVDDTLSADARARLDAHTADCDGCRAELDDLRELRQSLGPASLRPPRRVRSITTPLAIAAALLLAVSVFWLTRSSALWLTRSSARRQQARDEQTPTSAPRPSAAPTAAAVAPVARLVIPSDVAALFVPDGTLMHTGPEIRSGSFTPTATAVRNDRPRLRWTTVPDATTYMVDIFDVEFDPVAVSPPLTVTEWTPSTALPRGTIYTWQVRAARAGGETILPQPPAPPARFKILSADEEAAFRAAERELARPSLPRALLLARTGLLDESEQELEALVDRESSARPVLEELRRRRAGK